MCIEQSIVVKPYKGSIYVEREENFIVILHTYKFS